MPHILYFLFVVFAFVFLSRFVLCTGFMVPSTGTSTSTGTSMVPPVSYILISVYHTT